jgi:hypothetical protein
MLALESKQRLGHSEVEKKVEVADFYHYKEWENIICHGREKYILQNK